MSLLRDIVKEMAATGATGAHAVAAAPGSLFAGGVVDRNKKHKFANAHRIKVSDMKNTIKNRNKMKWRVIGEMVDEPKFDAADVMSKLDAAQKKADMDQDTIPFGMEDEEGNIVKVYVQADQADEFESALASLLSGQDEDEDDQNTPMEIAEVLFQLKDKFDIIDVEWPEIEGDVEEEQEVAGDEGMGDEEMPMDDQEGMDLEGGEGEDQFDDDAEGEDLEGEDLEMEPEGGAESALQQVIDMMKTDAEARAAEAEARAAEANAQAAAAKVNQEEQVLDMEAYNEKKKEEEEEAKRLAKLAKWKHQTAQDAETKLAQEEEEERLATNNNDAEPHQTRPREREDKVISKDELMTRILDYLRANS